jgi:autotransporter-associated beta strand protein
MNRYRRRRRLTSAAAGLLVAAAGGSAAHAQIATLDKGHNILVNNGLQIWGTNTNALPGNGFSYSTMEGANMNGVMWGFPAQGTSDVNAVPVGKKWGRWTDYRYDGTTVTPQNALTAAENARKNDLIALQVGDEQQSDILSGSMTKNWLLAAGNGTATTADDVFPNTLLYVNSFYIGDHTAYANFIQQANPDAISWDSYPFANPSGHYITPTNWLALGQQFRRHGLGSYIGATNAAPRPYGMFLQTYNDTFAQDPGEAQMRWQQFAAWTMGYKFVDAFIYQGNNTNFGPNPTGAVYQGFKESARQGRNLGPALTRLISYGYGTSIVQGLDANGQTNPVPGDWLVFNKDNAPAAQRYLTNVSATNLGTKNAGNRGDVYIGFFNPLHLSFGDPAGTAYFMVMNGLGGNLTLGNGDGTSRSDNTATVAETTQRLTLEFDTGWQTVNSLQRLNRNTANVETLPLTAVAGSFGTKYTYTFDLEGGTGDLFKYNDGYPFVGKDVADSGTVYWDPDGNAAGNNTSTGAGLGGSGTWDSFNPRFYDGTVTDRYSIKRNPVFWGPGGTITVTAGPPVDSMTFKSNYTLTGSQISLVRPFVGVDAGVTATISSTLSGAIGLVKNGPGTLSLTGTNNFSGGTTINDGTVRIGSDAALGTAPSALATNIALNGGTLQFGANLDIANTRGIGVGPLGGIIDTNGFSNAAGYNPSNGFRGPGDITKTGAGTFFASAPTGGANTLWTGRLILKQGIWKIIASDGLPYNVPLADGLKADQVTLDGGTWQAGTTLNITNGRRGITVAAGGGTIDTQGFGFTWAGPLAGSVTSANLNKIGTGLLRFNSSAANGPATFAGNLNINAGTVQLDGGTAMGDLASVNLANGSGAALAISGGDETIGSLAGGGPAGGTVSIANGFTLTTGGNGNSTTFAGVISGVGALKTGGSTMTLGGANTFTGGMTVNTGTVVATNHDALGSGGLTVGNGATGRVTAGRAKALSLTGVTTTGTGTLDLTDNDLVVRHAAGAGATTLAAIAAQVKRGLNLPTGFWTGDGITSSTAAADPQFRKALGAISNDLAVVTNGQFTGPFYTSFSGRTVDQNAVLVKFTWFGDADLSGSVDGTDYGLIDAGFLSNGSLTGWFNGDFDYNGTIDGTDYGLIDGAFLTQDGSTLGTPAADAILAKRDAQFGPVYVATLVAALEAGQPFVVPEPASVGLLALAGLGLLRRDRRRP